MMKTSADQRLSERMAVKSDEELRGMFGRAGEWREEALEMARVELERRGVTVPERKVGASSSSRKMPVFKLVCLGVARMVAGVLVGMVGLLLGVGIFGSSGPAPAEWVPWAGAAVFMLVAVMVMGFVGWGVVTVARGVVRGRRGSGREAGQTAAEG